MVIHQTAESHYEKCQKEKQKTKTTTTDMHHLTYRIRSASNNFSKSNDFQEIICLKLMEQLLIRAQVEEINT